jgi:hypothetical protein
MLSRFSSMFIPFNISFGETLSAVVREILSENSKLL